MVYIDMKNKKARAILTEKRDVTYICDLLCWIIFEVWKWFIL